jgi:hypothetical protein
VVASAQSFEDLVLIKVRVLLALLNLHFNYYEHSKLPSPFIYKLSLCHLNYNKNGQINNRKTPLPPPSIHNKHPCHSSDPKIFSFASYQWAKGDLPLKRLPLPKPLIYNACVSWRDDSLWSVQRTGRVVIVADEKR